MLKKKLKIYKNNTGFLVPISFKKDIPFKPKRVFLVYGKKGYIRAKHAHYKCKQFIVVISGKVEVSHENAKSKSKVILGIKKNYGFLSKPLTWIKIKFLTNQCIIMVFCDKEYDYNDYIVHYKDFLKKIKKK